MAPPKAAKKTFKKVGQKKTTPPKSDPIYIFYTSLYKQNKNSTMAITWMLQHGAFGPKTAEKMAMMLDMEKVKI